MIEFVESVEIESTVGDAWAVMCAVDDWWLRSNPEHDDLTRLDSGPLREGSRLRIQEHIGGVPGEATGVITQFVEGRSVTWEAEAHYRWLGTSVPVEEGVTWSITPDGSRAIVTARVWAKFRPGPVGRLMQMVFVHLLDGVRKDRAHTRIELEYLRDRIERSR